MALLPLRALVAEVEQGVRPVTHRDYQHVINKHLVPFFGRYSVASIDAALERE